LEEAAERLHASNHYPLYRRAAGAFKLKNGTETALEAARRLAFALAIAEQAAIDAQPAVIKNEKAEAISAKQSD
jgi:hypothetical protein